jgi:hypothetical protein
MLGDVVLAMGQELLLEGGERPTLKNVVVQDISLLIKGLGVRIDPPAKDAAVLAEVDVAARVKPEATEQEADLTFAHGAAGLSPG